MTSIRYVMRFKMNNSNAQRNEENWLKIDKTLQNKIMEYRRLNELLDSIENAASPEWQKTRNEQRQAAFLLSEWMLYLTNDKPF